MGLQQRHLLRVACAAFLVISVILTLTVSSIFIVFGLRWFFEFLQHFITFVGEVIAALVSAVASGLNLTLTVVLSVMAAQMTFSASYIEARIGVSMAVSALAVFVSAAALCFLVPLKIDLEVLSAVVGATSFSVACAAAWAVGVTSLIERETQQVGLKMTSITDAVRHNHHRLLRLLVSFHSGPRQKDLDVGLLHAVKAGFHDCCRVLLLAKANVNATDSYDNTPLMLACEQGDAALVEMLLDFEADVLRTNSGRSTALHSAAQWAHEHCIRLLIPKNPDLDAQDAQWRTPLMLTAAHAHPAEDLMRMLIKAGCDVNLVCQHQKTALHLAAARGLSIKVLITAATKVDASDTHGNTSLSLAAAGGHLQTITELLDFGANPDRANHLGKTPSHSAAQAGSVDCLNSLLSHGAHVHYTDIEGNNLLWYATQFNRKEALAFGISCNCPLSDLLLTVALRNGHWTVAKMLLLAGAPTHSLRQWLLQPNVECSDEDLEWIQGYVYLPWSLCHLTRQTIRACVGPTLPSTQANNLPLPLKLIEYLKFHELNEQFDDSPQTFEHMKQVAICG